MTTAVPSARLGGLYGLYFAVVALSIGWFGPFFDSLGFSAPQIGLAIGCSHRIKKLSLPYLWGTLGDLLPNRLRVVQVGIIGATLAASLLLIDVDFIGPLLGIAAVRLVLERHHRAVGHLDARVSDNRAPSVFLDPSVGVDWIYL